MQIVTDVVLLQMLRRDEGISFKMLYSVGFPIISGYITTNAGTKEDAEDVFQEAIIVLWKKIRNPDFELTCSLKTFLFAIAKNIWLNRLRAKKKGTVYHLDAVVNQVEDYVAEVYEESKQEEKLQVWLQSVTQHCQWLITTFYYLQHPMEKIMEKMGWKNMHTASNQKYKCVQMLKKQMQKESFI